MKKIFSLSFITIGFLSFAQQKIIAPAENLVADGIPAISSTLASEVKNYTEARSASFAAWHPLYNEIIISTRFGNANQLHYLKMPGGARTQITFFDEPVSVATFEPTKGNYFLFMKDVGGNEFSQIYRYDVVTKKSTLITDGGKSQNGNISWNNKGDKMVYTSTKRNGKDRDIYLMNPLDPGTEKKLLEVEGGGWGISGWSNDDSKLLLGEGLSVNESRIYVLDIATGTKIRLLPEKDERTTYDAVGYSKDDAGIFIITNKDNEFNRLAYYHIASKKITYITSAISWDVDAAAMNKDKSQLAFYTNENGISKLYVMSTTPVSSGAAPKGSSPALRFSFVETQNIPKGVISGIYWKADSKSFAFTLTTHNSSSDVYEYNIETKYTTRWTESELGGMDISTLQEPQLVSWKSFDGKMISGFVYKASSKFSGKRPVIISIHGGPEGQSKPVFQARNNYFLNELGVTIIYPNVRGSSGYGKTFLDMDNGFKRLESVQDIGALIDWIATQPDLDKDRIMVMGGSYGGYMSLAVSCMYSDKIRCAIDVVGISHFSTFMKNTEAYRRDLRRVEYGDERDPKMAEFFEKIAPLNQVEKIKKPLFIVQGGNDPRVPLSEAEQMKEKIKQRGGTVWYLMAKDEGHGFKKKNNADFQFYATIEFIKEYLLK